MEQKDRKRGENMRQEHTNSAGDWLANLEKEPNKEPFEDPTELPTHFAATKLFAAEDITSEELRPLR